MEAAAATAGPSASVLNVTDNKKRWMVFGLALKILADHIRPFEEKEIQTAYATVKRTRGIDSQWASGRLKRLPTLLNYENINGNDAMPKVDGKYNYSAFDCRVTSHVDFAKLYLENRMAKFTTFDEHCDVSSVITLLCNFVAFPIAVQNAANIVRHDRNAWAHCVFQHWDAAKFRQSFQDMERLVNALGMPAGDKTNLLAELKVWETTGPSLCMNTSVDPVLLQMVEQHVNKLIADVDNLIFDVECDKNIIKKTLQDVGVEVKELAKRLSVVEGKVEIVEQRVTQLENQRTFSLPQISIEIASCEGEISFFANRHDADTRQWLVKDFDEWFLSPGDSRAYVLLGDAGVGKSVIAGALAQRARNAGYLGAAYFCRRYDDTRNDPRNLLGTVASQLCKCNVHYSNIVGGESVVRMMLANGKLGVLELFTKLLQEPLGKCTPCKERKLVIIDALNETKYKSRNDFLDLVMHRFPMLPNWVLFFITSHPEDTVQSTLQNYHPCIKICAGSDKHLHVYQQHEQDIKRFFEKRVDFSRLPYTAEDITKKCYGLFLYAFYMVGVLSDVGPGNVAELNERFPGNIESYFREKFNRVFDKVGVNLFKTLFGCVVVAPSPLPQSFILFLLKREKSNLDVQEVIDTVSIFLVLRESDQAYTFLHNLIPSWLTNCTKAGKCYIDRAEAGEYLKQIVLELLPSVINVASKKHSSIETGLLDYVLRFGVCVLCKYEDAHSMKIVFNCLKSYQFIQKRIHNSRIGICSVIGDLKLSALCQTLPDTEKVILQEICICLERSIHTLLECPHLLQSCLQKASKAVKSIMTIPDEVSTTWMELRWLPYSISKTSCGKTKGRFALSPDKKLLAQVKHGWISLFNSCSLEKSLGPVEETELERSSHLAFSLCGDFVFFGKFNRAFSVKRGGVVDYFHSKEFNFLYEWCSFTLDQQHIVVKRASPFPPTCWSCLLNYLCLWARKEITQSQRGKPLCRCFPSRLIFPGLGHFPSHIRLLPSLIALLRQMQCEEWCSLLENVEPGKWLPECKKCKSSEEYEALTLKEVRQFIIDHYAEIFRYQVWDRRTSKPVLDEVFSSGAELDAFTYLCHSGTAFEVCGSLFTGIEQSISLGNIALPVTVCHCIIFRHFLEAQPPMRFHGWLYSSTNNLHEAIENVSALRALSTTIWLELQNFPDEDKKVFFSGCIPCLSAGAIWVAKTRGGHTGATVYLFRARQSLQEQNSYNPEHVIEEVAHFGFTNDQSFFVYFSVHHSLHALSLQSGTILRSVSGVCPWVFDPEGQPGYLFHADDEDVTIFLKDFPREFLKHLVMSPVNTPMQINYVSDATLLVVCADSSVVSFQANDNRCANSFIPKLSSDFGTLGLQQLKRCAFSPDGKLIAAYCGAKITLHDTSGSDGCRFLCTVCEPECQFTVLQLIFSADSTLLFYCILQGGSRLLAFLWNVREKVEPQFFDPPVVHPEDFCCCFTMDNKLVLCSELYIQIFDLAANLCRSLTTLAIDVIYDEAGKITYCTVSPKNDLLACCIVDRIVLYSLDNPTNKPVLKLPRAHLGKIEFCRFLKGNRHMISYGIDGAVFLWDLLEQTAVSFITIPHKRENITFVAVSPNEDNVVGCTSLGRLFAIKLYGLKSEMLSLQLQSERMMREHSPAQAVCPNAEQIAKDTDISELVEEMNYMYCSDLSEDSDGDETEISEADQ